MDLYLALDRGLAGRLALFGPLTAHCVWSQGAFAAPVQSAAMVFTHVVGVQTLLAWNYELVQVGGVWRVGYRGAGVRW